VFGERLPSLADFASRYEIAVRAARDDGIDDDLPVCLVLLCLVLLCALLLSLVRGRRVGLPITTGDEGGLPGASRSEIGADSES